MINDDIKKLKYVSSLSEEESHWIWENYKFIDIKTEPIPQGKWETACKSGNDWKYGRFMICRDKMLRRGLTFDEFYGGGIVD